MRVHHPYAVLVVLLGLGCGSGVPLATVEPGSGPPGVGPGGSGAGPARGPGGSESEATGLEGTALRGPTRPVCRVDNPCIAPFSATFEVWQGERVVARFQSDADGHFLIHLAPGVYTVVPDASAGILARSQVHEVTVGPDGLTHVEWEFDTGIR
jgi:hypothetical protein